VRRKDDIGEAAAAAIENNVFNFADILAARVLDLRSDDAATLNVARACSGAGLTEQRSHGETQKRQGSSERYFLFHKL
jgi:hypothetical protein